MPVCRWPALLKLILSLGAAGLVVKVELPWLMQVKACVKPSWVPGVKGVDAVVKTWQLERENLKFKFQRPETNQGSTTEPETWIWGQNKQNKQRVVVPMGWICGLFFFGPKCIQDAWFSGMALKYYTCLQPDIISPFSWNIDVFPHFPYFILNKL